MLRNYLKNKRVLLKLSYLLQYPQSNYSFAITDFDKRLVKYARKKYEEFKNRQIRTIRTTRHENKDEVALSDFNDFILMQPTNERIYKCLRPDDLVMEWLLERYDKGGFKECPFCSKKIDVNSFERHVKEEINPEGDGQGVSKIRVLVEFECDKKVLTITSRNVKEAKKEISAELKLPVSKLHLFDGKRALKNTDDICGSELTLRMKR
ncbi:hypothetical protein THOM_1909 [Trachipleistophora hominis]|uniref:Ubiquitin-like domain-containing protein n=1 Tax=Trachipleistophora hominis TaxID=72359 RepID=L7JWT2_TRAHO|nr:hypothetical protein THOM_1909 [Trachipleistophora hominis]